MRSAARAGMTYMFRFLLIKENSMRQTTAPLINFVVESYD